ncbi:hypothetical protein ACHAW5_000322 [Stephanodiscus triporus]|uniref:Lipid desaturase domain-containing protein n=1 Tax=Stephanodiscus triporus TaxID=2934178 RepID=A0ABD3MP26_9STRA
MCRPSNTAKAALSTGGELAPPSSAAAASPHHQYYPRHFYFAKEGKGRGASRARSRLDPLNAKVESITSKWLKARIDDPSMVLPPSVLLSADGALVYPDRWRSLPVAFAVAACYLISLCPNIVMLVVGIVVMYFESDLYSGVVHVVLDDPKNLDRSNYLMEAIMFQGCLEFQWHHAIPRDIVIKGLLSSCADLNVVVFANMIVIAMVHGVPFVAGGDDRDDDDDRRRLLWSLLGLKLLYGYFGQLNHLMAHESEGRRPRAVRALQDNRVMLDQGRHNGHHRTYDDNYCLLGHMDWAVRLIDERCVPDLGGRRHHVWFAIWMVMSVFCLPCAVVPVVRAIAGCIYYYAE